MMAKPEKQGFWEVTAVSYSYFAVSDLGGLPVKMKVTIRAQKRLFLG